MHYSVCLIFIGFSTVHMAWWHVCFCFYPVIRLSQAGDLVVPCAILLCTGAAVESGHVGQAENQTLMSAQWKWTVLKILVLTFNCAV